MKGDTILMDMEAHWSVTLIVLQLELSSYLVIQPFHKNFWKHGRYR